ncbi:MAG: FAD-binding oxidoreductase [Candidatus Hadarchaeales archaeon]
MGRRGIRFLWEEGGRGRMGRLRPALPEAFLREARDLVGERDLRTEEAELFSHAKDAWLLGGVWFSRGKEPILPGAVAYPESTEEVSGLVRLCCRYKVPLVPYGGGTGVVGGALPPAGALVVDLKKMNRLLEVDGENLLARVQAGMNGWRYEEELNRRGYTGGHIPQSLPSSTVGGWIAHRAAGQFSTKYGKIEDLVAGLEAVMPDGTVVRSRAVPRSATGPRLEQLLLGSEGMLGIITEATLRIFPFPERRLPLSFTFPSLEGALEAARRILRRGFRPAVLRIYDGEEVGLHFKGVVEEGRVLSLFLLEGDGKQVEVEGEVVEGECRSAGGSPSGEKPVEHWLRTRFDVHLAQEVIRGGGVVDTVEVAILWSRAAELYRKVRGELEGLEGMVHVSGHFSHFYPEGVCLYLTFAGFPSDPEAFYWGAWEKVMKATLELGGTISHHHGVGLVRARWMEEELGGFLSVLRKIKGALDPQNLMNPGKAGWGDGRGGR